MTIFLTGEMFLFREENENTERKKWLEGKHFVR